MEFSIVLIFAKWESFIQSLYYGRSNRRITLKNLLLRMVISVLLPLFLCSQVHAQDDAAQIRELFERYIDAWNRADLMTIGSEIYRTPVYIFESGETRIFSSAKEIADLLGALRIQLDQAGFSHSELKDVSICDLGGGLAFASFHYSRIDQAGKEMEEKVLSSAYITRRYDDGWHLVAHVMQEQPGRLSCAN